MAITSDRFRMRSQLAAVGHWSIRRCALSRTSVVSMAGLRSWVCKGEWRFSTSRGTETTPDAEEGSRRDSG